MDHLSSFSKIEALHGALCELEACQSAITQLNGEAMKEICKIDRSFFELKGPVYKARDRRIHKLKNFWLSALLGHAEVSKLITEEVEDCLCYLLEIKVEECVDNGQGFRIHFTFDRSNPHFDNEHLVKELIRKIGEAPVSSSTVIKWKKGQAALQESPFFLWFMDSSNPATDFISLNVKEEVYSRPLHYYFGYICETDDNASDFDELKGIVDE